MKTILLSIAVLCISLGSPAQTDVTSILNAQLPGTPGVLLLGCCNDDGLSPDGTNPDLCLWQDYIAYGDIELHRSRLVLRNCSLTIVEGNFITNNIEIEYTCGAELIFDGEGRLAMTREDLETLNVKQLQSNPSQWPQNTDFAIYNILGQTIYQGKSFEYGLYRELVVTKQQVWVVRFKGYKAMKI